MKENISSTTIFMACLMLAHNVVHLHLHFLQQERRRGIANMFIYSVFEVNIAEEEHLHIALWINRGTRVPQPDIAFRDDSRK